MKKALQILAKPVIAPLAVAALVFALTGCSSGGRNVREILGVGTTPPDEFAVVTKAPLELPPDYNLRPPEPGAPRPQETPPRDQAAAALFKGSIDDQSAYPAGASLGEQALLSKANALDADSNIRQIVNSETLELEDKNVGFIDELLFWREGGVPATTVKAGEESERLRINEQAGKSVTEGETPMKLPAEKKGLFE